MRLVQGPPRLPDRAEPGVRAGQDQPGSRVGRESIRELQGGGEARYQIPIGGGGFSLDPEALALGRVRGVANRRREAPYGRLRSDRGLREPQVREREGGIRRRRQREVLACHAPAPQAEGRLAESVVGGCLFRGGREREGRGEDTRRFAGAPEVRLGRTARLRLAPRRYERDGQHEFRSSDLTLGGTAMAVHMP